MNVQIYAAESKYGYFTQPHRVRSEHGRHTRWLTVRGRDPGGVSVTSDTGVSIASYLRQLQFEQAEALMDFLIGQHVTDLERVVTVIATVKMTGPNACTVFLAETYRPEVVSAP